MQGADTKDAVSERAGFWRRIAAILIDVIFISAVVGAFGAALYGPTNGAIRVRNTVIWTFECSATSVNRPDLRVPADFKPNAAAVCIRRFLGVEHDRVLVMAEVTKSGNVTHRRAINLPVDAQGGITRAIYLDYLTIFFIAIYLVVLEWGFGRTLGKRLLGLRACSLGGSSIKLSQAAIRTLVRLIPSTWIIVVILIFLVLDPARPMSTLMSNMVIIYGSGFVLSLVFLLNFILAVRRKNLPWHDRLAGTEVVRATPSAIEARVE